MIRPSPASRRVLLAATVLVGACLAAAAAPPAEADHGRPFSRPLVIPKVLTGSNITLTAKLADVQILPGAKTKMWTYNGTFPGPTIRRPTGQTTTVTLVNDLPRRGRRADPPQPRQPLDRRRTTASRTTSWPRPAAAR